MRRMTTDISSLKCLVLRFKFMNFIYLTVLQSYSLTVLPSYRLITIFLTTISPPVSTLTK